MRTIRFHSRGQRDADHAYVSALLGAGYERTNEMEDADFFLTDHEPLGEQARARFIDITNDKPIFLFPHTPYAYWLWDGLIEPLPVACNFVVAEGPKCGMQAYGYPSRVEVVGFPRSNVRAFQPTTGKYLLYSSARLLKYGFPHEGDRIAHHRTMEWICEHRESFSTVTVHYSRSLIENELTPYTTYDLKLKEIGKHIHLSAKTAERGFEHADLVITCNTFGHLSIAAGKPTLLFGYDHDLPPHSTAGFGRHYDAYREHYDFPLRLQDMTIEQVLALRDAPHPKIEEWKRMNVGTSFDAEKFLRVVGEYL